MKLATLEKRTVSVGDPTCSPLVERLLANLRARKIPGLDGIRGIAALTVIGDDDIWLDHHPQILEYFYPSRAAVTTFFLISGFLITWLLLREEQKDGRVDRIKFYARRAFRLLPGLLALLLWEKLVRLPPVTKHAKMAALFYYANYFMLFGGTIAGLGQTWSLAVEEHFYFLWPQAFVFVRNKTTLLKGCLVVCGLQLALRLFLGFSGFWSYAQAATETASLSALAGCIMALVLWHSPHRIPHFVFQPWLTPAALLAILILNLFPSREQCTWGIPLVIPCAAILIVQAVTYEWRILENPIARYLGRISYSVYLWGRVAIALVGRIGHDKFGLMAFAVAICIGSLSYYLVERPIQSFGRKQLSI